MHIADCWALLGIAPTEDLKEIRRAYARKLKTIDVQAHPAHFVELRNAYDVARATSENHAPRPHAQTAERSAEDVGPSRSPDSPVREGKEWLAREIVDLLGSPSSAAQIEPLLSDLTLRLLAAIDRETVDLQFESEEWVATIIAENIPRSDAMIRPATAHFRWLMLQHGQLRASKATLATDRLHDLNFAEFLVLPPEGRHHGAYLTLQQPPRRGLFHKPDYAGLAALERFFRETGDEPQVANVTFDPDIVKQWHDALRRYDLGLENWKASRRSRGWRCAMYALALAMIAFASLVLLAMNAGDRKRQAPREEFSSGVGAESSDR